MPLQTIENVLEIKTNSPQILPKHASLLPHQKLGSSVLALVAIICWCYQLLWNSEQPHLPTTMKNQMSVEKYSSWNICKHYWKQNTKKSQKTHWQLLLLSFFRIIQKFSFYFHPGTPNTRTKNELFYHNKKRQTNDLRK